MMYFPAILFSILFALGSSAQAYDVILAWDPNDEPDLAGYNVYVNQIGPGSQYYQLDTVLLREIETDNPRYTATGLKEESDYCFVVTAYDSNGYESGFSNEACVLNGQEISSNLSQNRGGGGGGGGCFITISKD